MTTAIYHITSLKNLASILQMGGLMSKNKLSQEQTTYTNIAYEGIQDRRAKTSVPLGRGGVLHDYAPFYFAPRSPMLYAIHKNRVEGYREGQSPILHLVTTAEAIEATGLVYVFTDGHATVAYSDFYDDLGDLGCVDWEVMESRFWADTDDDPDRKRRRQAEFLVYDFVPWHLIVEIGAIDRTIGTQVERMLQGVQHRPRISVRSNWYY